MIARALAAACRAVAARVDPKVVSPGPDPYLSKYRLAGSRDPDGWELRLHLFHRGDAGTDLHNHTGDGLSLVLVNGYREERVRADGALVTLERRPGDVVVVLADTFHRLDLPWGPSWTLFLAGPKRQRWGFIDRQTRAAVPPESPGRTAGRKPPTP